MDPISKTEVRTEAISTAERRQESASNHVAMASRRVDEAREELTKALTNLTEAQKIYAAETLVITTLTGH